MRAVRAPDLWTCPGVAEPWLSAEKIAAHPGNTKDAVNVWIADTKLRAHGVGRLWRFQISEIDEWVCSGGAAPDAEHQGVDARVRIIDNLGDDLKASIKRGSKLRIAVSSFAIFAFEALNVELQSIEELEFIFTARSFTTTKATHKQAPEKRLCCISNDKRRDAALSGAEFEIRLHNRLTQRAIARKCADRGRCHTVVATLAGEGVRAWRAGC